MQTVLRKVKETLELQISEVFVGMVYNFFLLIKQGRDICSLIAFEERRSLGYDRILQCKQKTRMVIFIIP